MRRLFQLLAIGVLLAVGTSSVEAQYGGICQTCDDFITGECDGTVEDPDDHCFQGVDDDDNAFCASWGSIIDCSVFWTRDREVRWNRTSGTAWAAS